MHDPPLHLCETFQLSSIKIGWSTSSIADAPRGA
jgi:hypothetical protein